MKMLAILLEMICTVFLGIYFSGVFWALLESRNRFYSHDMVLLFGIFWLISRCITLVAFWESEDKISKLEENNTHEHRIKKLEGKK